MRRIQLQQGEEFSNAHLQRKSAFNAKALEIATQIVADVRERGDECLRELTAKFDGVEIDNFRVPQQSIDDAVEQCDPVIAEALEHASASRPSVSDENCASLATRPGQAPRTLQTTSRRDGGG